MKKQAVQLAFILLTGLAAQAQQDPETGKIKKQQGFYAGVSFGTCFASNSTSALYDGYGYDALGQRNDFANSFMYRRIVFDYGGANNQPDYIAQALGVNHGDWNFDITDMPLSVKYNTAVIPGLQARYYFNNNNCIFLNAMGSKFYLGGNFTISLNTNINQPLPPNYSNVKTFSITGREQRLLFQLGYQYIFGDETSTFDFFVEAGANCTLAKMERNQLFINSLTIDLMAYYTYPAYNDWRDKHLRGLGFGAFGGCGFDLYVNPKTSLQFAYAPSLENIHIGADPKLSLQHYILLRVLYRIGRRGN